MKKTGTLGRQYLIQLKDKVLKELSDLGAYSYHAAKTGGHYIKFRDPRVGSLRISDHHGKRQYSYRWNLVVGCRRRTTTDEKNRQRDYYPPGDINDLFNEVRAHANNIVQLYGLYDPQKDPFKDKRYTTRPKKWS